LRFLWGGAVGARWGISLCHCAKSESYFKADSQAHCQSHAAVALAHSRAHNQVPDPSLLGCARRYDHSCHPVPRKEMLANVAASGISSAGLSLWRLLRELQTQLPYELDSGPGCCDVFNPTRLVLRSDVRRESIQGEQRHQSQQAVPAKFYERAGRRV